MSGLKWWSRYFADLSLRLIPFGMSGLKYFSPSRHLRSWRLIPFGMSGLKLNQLLSHVLTGGSHPVWDEWIEMLKLSIIALFLEVSSRLGWVDWNPAGYISYKESMVSSRLGWVDWNTPREIYYLRRKMSHPVWDEWIEINSNFRKRNFILSLIPFGMSGLKCRF